ncbi:hypothetical protein PGTUg99_030391 [Puccinia graminis f. sp. tritici]|uniref:Uncharacterized protein n=1 Tax=Puccinia graminis f. sp. tritici TaxID=56615 RepID=A0A5B0P603_PUCGR|nr:hypothetical protein PGTUg99_030391 [Puccinia graminis f. sp. tritici]
MTLHRVVLVVLISLLNLQGSLQQNKPPSLKDITCGRKMEFQAGDCKLSKREYLPHWHLHTFSSLSTPNQYSAYHKIIYDADSTLNHNERNVERTSGGCVTHIENIKWLKIPKALIEDGFEQILAKCNGYAGNATLPGFDGVRLMTRRHTHPDAHSYEDDIELNKVFCLDGPKDVKIVKQDCVEYVFFFSTCKGYLASWMLMA